MTDITVDRPWMPNTVHAERMTFADVCIALGRSGMTGVEEEDLFPHIAHDATTQPSYDATDQSSYGTSSQYYPNYPSP